MGPNTPPPSKSISGVPQILTFYYMACQYLGYPRFEHFSIWHINIWGTPDLNILLYGMSISGVPQILTFYYMACQYLGYPNFDILLFGMSISGYPRFESGVHILTCVSYT